MFLKKYTMQLQFPSTALSASGNVGIISACDMSANRNIASTPLYSGDKETEKNGEKDKYYLKTH